MPPPDRTFEFVVVGSGTGALVTAWALARLGRSVIRVGSPFPAPDRMVGTGWCAEPPPAGFEPSPPPVRALLVRGRLLRLPLSPTDRARVLPGARVAPASLALGRARVTSAVAAFVGGGREERSYRDWVRYRFGEPIYDEVFAPYARARFGDPEEILCGVARVTHGEAVASGSRVPAGIFGGPPPLDATVTAITEGVVTTDHGVIHGRIVVDLTPAELLRVWSRAADPALDLEAARLQARHGIEVFLPGQLPAGIQEIHVVGAPFFRVVEHGDELAVHMAVEPGAAEWTEPDHVLAKRIAGALRELGLTATPDFATVRRLPHHHPLWRTSHLTRLRTWTDTLEDGGIEPIGRLGLVAPMSPSAIAAYAEDRLIAGASLRDCIRHHVEPPPRDSEARPRLSEFVTR